MTNETIIEDFQLVPLPAWWRNPWWWVAIVVVLAVLIYLVRLWWKSRPRKLVEVADPNPLPPPHLEALRRLAELRSRQPKITTYETVTECSDILRTYIEARFASTIRYQTTREFLGATQAHPELSEIQKNELGEFLRFFDRIKFATDSASSEETSRGIDFAENFIRHCIPKDSSE
ncbi:MAG: DUF4381 family protein [Verrucomicrobiota bacterium]